MNRQRQRVPLCRAPNASLADGGPRVSLPLGGQPPMVPHATQSIRVHHAVHSPRRGHMSWRRLRIPFLQERSCGEQRLSFSQQRSL